MSCLKGSSDASVFNFGYVNVLDMFAEPFNVVTQLTCQRQQTLDGVVQSFVIKLEKVTCNDFLSFHVL